jgi:hypothetical protein
MLGGAFGNYSQTLINVQHGLNLISIHNPQRVNTKRYGLLSSFSFLTESTAKLTPEDTMTKPSSTLKFIIAKVLKTNIGMLIPVQNPDIQHKRQHRPDQAK